MTIPEYNDTVGSYADNLYRFIRSNLRDGEQARDIVQEAYARLWLKVDDIAFDKARAFLFTTGYRVMIDWLRREKKNADFEQADTNSLSSEQEESDLNEILHKALARLPEIQRTVILLRDYEGYSYQEIAEIAALSESQVKVYIYRARVSLKNYLVSIDYII